MHLRDVHTGGTGGRVYTLYTSTRRELTGPAREGFLVERPFGTL